ncbi:hypothetical protein [Sphingobacterium griseoflavum]|uniref:DUF4843 domain-containing protein n=1 Tax=Sphingobacterium griseoflavum TaxID=1474952 RepID=A0ABQ3HQL0_9SPHI|nr:hypothetical protein [Sphingobacterium griseoflavum]GHE23134.1 hypothetical protein GCM10017764_01020 [Sphingobacterium griseoflavum]
MKTISVYTSFLVLLSILQSSCNNASNKASKTAGAEKTLGQFVGNDSDNPSLYLYLADTHETDSSVIYLAKSLHETDTVGLQIEVSKNIPAGVGADGNPDEKDGFKNGVIKFSTIGRPSDAFVQALSKAYKSPVEGGMTTSPILPLVFSSNKQPVDLSKNSTYSFKLFLSNRAGAEAEAFAILDLYRRLFELKARDTSQFDRLVSAFQEPQ